MMRVTTVIILLDFMAQADIQVGDQIVFHSTSSKNVSSNHFKNASRLIEEHASRNGSYYFINLARRQDRLAKLEQTISASSPHLWQQMERIDAVDGKGISLEDPALEAFVKAGALKTALMHRKTAMPTIRHLDGRCVEFNDFLTEGGVACAMSHHRALQAIAYHPTAQWGLILEDDIASTVPQADKVIESLISQLPTDWDVVYLGHHHHDKSSLADGDGLKVRFHPLDSQHVAGLYAWVVRKQAAKKILEGAFPVDRQVDHALSAWLRAAGMRAFMVAANSLLFHSLKSEEGLDSDIQKLIKADKKFEIEKLEAEMLRMGFWPVTGKMEKREKKRSRLRR